MASNSTQPGNEGKSTNARADMAVTEKDGSPKPATKTPKASTSPTEQYKIVKVRMPDGTVKSMKRKVAPSDGLPNAAPRANDKQKTPLKTEGGIQTETVSVKLPDGTMKKITRRVHTNGESPSASSTSAATAVAETGAKTGAKTGAASKPEINSITSSPATVRSATTYVNSAPVTPTGGSFSRPRTPHMPSSSARNGETESSPSQEGLKGKTAFTAATAVKASASDIPEAAIPEDDKTSRLPSDMEAALAEQAKHHSETRTRRFKRSMIRTIATVAASSIPALEISDWRDEHHGGDDDDDDDWWGDDDDEDVDDDDGNGDGEVEDFDPDVHHGVEAEADHDVDAHGSNNDDSHSGHSEDTLFRFDAGKAIGAAATAAANAAAQPQPRQPPPVAQPAGDGTATKEKLAYNITAKELDSMDEKAAEKNANRQLKRQWSNISFYILASFIITFPLLFIALGLCIVCGMRNQPVDSRWNMMENAIKVGVSSWPIVFAAVVAQMFKAWATYKVERGVKLLELEQLMGSNSFSSAMKQPFLLRNLNFLTLGLFAVWCLSPIGSQALQRVYTIGPQQIVDQVTIYQLDNTGENPLFSTDRDAYLNSSQFDQELQLATMYYLAAFLPLPQRDLELPKQDRFDNPITPQVTQDNVFYPSSAWGIPVILPDPIDPGRTEDQDSLSADVAESIDLQVTWSYFDMTCGNWSTELGKDLQNLEDFSWSTTWGLSFNNSTSSGTIDRLQFASRNGAPLNRGYDMSLNASALDVNADYSYIECSFRQVIATAPMHCVRRYLGSFLAPDCDADSTQVKELTADDLKKKNISGAHLRNFAKDWVSKGSLLSESLTPTELYLYNDYDLDSPSIPYQNWNLSKDVLPKKFEGIFQYEFNTWVGLGYCPQCLTITNYGNTPNTTVAPNSRWITVNGTRTYTNFNVYQIQTSWLVVYFISSSILLLAGIGSVVLEAMVVAPDVLGYVSTVARNSKYLKLPKTHSSGGERLQALGSYRVMLQDVAKKDAPVGRIGLGLKTDNAQPLRPGRLYR